jgi:hypothetical protein
VNPRATADSGTFGWIGVDLDGTLAKYDTWNGPIAIGDPVVPMVERVKRWLAEGRDVRIVTARVSGHGTPERDAEARAARHAVAAWCNKHIGKVLPITCCKDFQMIEVVRRSRRRRGSEYRSSSDAQHTRARMTAQIASLLCYIVGSLLFVAGSVILFVQAVR